MPTKLIDRLSLRRRSLHSAVAAVASLMALTVTQTMGTAAATDATKSNHLEACPSGQACLWINSSEDPDPAKRADGRALVITAGSGPDLSDATSSGKGKVHGMTAEFSDNISVGWNHLPYDLCLMDTTEYWDEDGEYGMGDAPLRSSRIVMPVRPGKAFSQLAEWNDTFDYYTTASRGGCPSGGVIFRSDNQEIVSRW